MPITNEALASAIKACRQQLTNIEMEMSDSEADVRIALVASTNLAISATTVTVALLQEAQ